jgi:tetratricopeptide (TPR) repeat protein
MPTPPAGTLNQARVSGAIPAAIAAPTHAPTPVNASGERRRAESKRLNYPAVSKKSRRQRESFWDQRDTMVVALLAAITLAVFAQVVTHEFLHYDDGLFTFENGYAMRGLTGPSIDWAISSSSLGWYPLTWLSHMLDVELWGTRAGAHLLINVLIHLISAALLYLALRRMTRAAWPSAIVAALFAIHPMHVESVAWVAERRDTLSTFFVMLALLVYAFGPQRRILLAVLFACSLMAKQMYVTLPFVLLLLDYWPLQRRPRFAEKIPLFVLSAIGCVVAVIGQRNLRAVQSAEIFPFATRVTNALVAYVRYLGKLFVPIDLAVLYPLQPISAAQAIGAALLLAAITIVVIRFRATAPYLLVGWLWFIGTLIPVIGIVQIGTQAIADRYTYFPYIGLFIAIVWGLRSLMAERILLTTASIVIVLLAAVSFRQVGYWKNTETLFRHTLRVTPPNVLAEYTLGQALQLTQPDRAIFHLRRSIELRQHDLVALPEVEAQAYVGLGTAILMKARPLPAGAQRDAIVDEAVAQFNHALAIDPNAEHAKNNLAVADQMRSQTMLNALLNNGTALSQQRKVDEAITEFRKAVALAPGSVEAHVYLALSLLLAKQNAEGVVELRNAKALDAMKANEFVTKAMQLPARADNLDRLIASSR